MNFSNKHKIKNFLHVPTLKRFQLGNPTLIPRFQLGNPKMIKSRHIAPSTLQENLENFGLAKRPLLNQMKEPHRQNIALPKRALFKKIKMILHGSTIALSTLVQENQDGSTMAPRQWLPFPGKGLGNLIQFNFNFYLLVQVLAWYNGPPHFMAPRWIHDCLLPTNDARHRSSTTQGSRLALLAPSSR